MAFKKGNHPRTQFKKGIIPWNKGIKTGLKPSNAFKKGHKLSSETIEKIRRTRLNKKKKITKLEYLKMIPRLKIKKERKPISNESRLKMHLSHKGKHHSINTEFKLGHHKLHSEETRNKIKESLIGHEVKKETREKLSIAVKEYIKENGYSFINTVIGKNETLILDNLEQFIGYRIVRQLCIEGFFLDGYIPELNLAIEIDEQYHNKISDKDKIREDIIKNKLGCEFLRIKDYD